MEQAAWKHWINKNPFRDFQLVVRVTAYLPHWL
jgi:hypothetical protein